MSQQFDVTPGLHLPEPTLEAHARIPNVSTAVPVQQGMQPVVSPPAPQPMADPIAATPVEPVAARQPLAFDPVAAQNVVAQDVGGAVDDDAIDEEWVNKAKEIVEQLHADPYKESNALSKLKSDYLKLRHNKDVKTSGDIK